MIRRTTLPLSVALLLASTAWVQADPAKIDISGVDLTKMPLLVSGTGPVLGTLKNADAISAAGAGGYAFSAGATPEAGSFRLGLLLADLQVAANAGDVKRTQAAADALLDTLVTLEASDALIASATQLAVALKQGVSTEAVARLARPLLEPSVRAFVTAQGKSQFFNLGDWSETLSLMLAARAPDSTDPVPFAKQATGYAADLAGDKAVSKGVLEALASLSEVGAATQPSARQIESAKQSLATLKSLLG